MHVVRQGVAVAVSAALTVIFSVALGSLLFTGRLAAHAADGVSLALLSALVVGVVVAWRGSVPGQLAGPQDSPTILLALAVTTVAAAAPAAMPDDALFATALAVIAVSTIGVGAGMLLLGRLRLGAVIRFMPYPVVGGFVAGTGWLILTGTIELLTGTTPGLGTVGELLGGEQLLRWLPAVLLAAVLLWAMERWQHPLILPVGILAAIGGFYAVLLIGGGRAAEALGGGWLLGPFPDAAAWRPDPAWVLQQADWGLVTGQIGTVASLFLVVLVAVVLTTTALELSLQTEGDVDRELRAAGLGSLLSGLAGGTIGYSWLSATVLGRTVGGRGRPFAVAVAAMSGVVLLVGVQPLTWLPRMALGTILLLVGFSFLYEWVVVARHRMPRTEHGIVLVIVVVVAAFGFLTGVAVGVVMAIIMFALAASRVDVVKHEMAGTERGSHVDRSPEEEAALAVARASVHIMVLHGFLFFGTAHSVAERVRIRLDAPDTPPVRYLVLDCRLVTGIDSSAVYAFTKLLRQLRSRGVVLVISQGSTDVVRALEGGGVTASEGVELLPDLDHALGWCEDRLLAEHDLVLDLTDLRTALAGLLAGTTPTDELLQLFQEIALAPGAMLIEQGSPPAGLYLITEGEVSVERSLATGQTVRVRQLRAGSVLGEMSLYLAAPATASVVAMTAVSAAFLSADDFETLERDRPDVAAALHRALVVTLATRLGNSHRAIEALLS